jgi:ribosomal protein L11 methyltransferase
MKDVEYPCLLAFVRPERAEEMSFALVDLEATAVEERDDGTMTGSARAGAVQLIAGFGDRTARDRAQDALLAMGLEAAAADVVDDGWSSGWQAFFQPVVLDRLQIVAPWMEPPRRDRETIVIDPGLAFGTGGHATTRLVVRLLERRAAKAAMPDAVLDVGVGSGVLSIAAVELGAGRALGVDIDPESIEATRTNAAANGVGESIEARLGSAADVDGEWPLVLANIELGAFLSCATDIAARVAPGGELLVSGLLEEQADACAALFPGFEIAARVVEDGWAALSMRRVG